jgi:hypothetical protein
MAENENIITRLLQKFRNKRNLLRIAGLLAGIFGGYLYYVKIGCNSGGCPITSNPYMSMLWGAVMGYLLADMFTGRKREKPQN